jgi:hypothetical protein
MTWFPCLFTIVALLIALAAVLFGGEEIEEWELDE